MKLSFHLLKYELLFALANKGILLSTSFFIILILIVGIGFGQIGESSEKTLLAIIWIAISLSSLLSIKTMFQEDFDDGTLDLYILSNTSIETIIFIKSIVHWITTNLPIITLIPLISFPLFNISTSSFSSYYYIWNENISLNNKFNLRHHGTFNSFCFIIDMYCNYPFYHFTNN